MTATGAGAREGITQEQILTGIVVGAGMDRIRHMLAFAPEANGYTTAYPDTEGRWWVVRVEACVDKDHAERLVGYDRADPQPDGGNG